MVPSFGERGFLILKRLGTVYFQMLSVDYHIVLLELDEPFLDLLDYLKDSRMRDIHYILDEIVNKRIFKLLL